MPHTSEDVVFDAGYFTTALPAHVKTAGDGPAVEIHLTQGHVHRVRAILETMPGYVVLEVYRHRIDGSRTGQQWGGPPRDDSSPSDLQRVAVSYESIAAVVITPADDAVSARIGFGRK
ncbi:MAG: hypothetical protein ABJF01_16710 [bacterium]